MGEIVQKPESKWRSNLIKRFKANNPKGFIWAHDPKFRHGFPDLELIVDGTVTHIELKVLPNADKHPLKNLDPRQKLVLEAITKAGGRGFVFVLFAKEKKVFGWDALTNTTWIQPQFVFEESFFSVRTLLT